MISGHSVVFQVRRVPGDVPSSITLDHGDLRVRDGSAQSEYAHRTMPGLQGPRVNLTYPWVTQHAASCPLAGVVGCVLPACAQGLVEPSSRWLGQGESIWSSSWGLVLLLLILVFALLVSTWIHIRRGIIAVVSVYPARRRSSHLGVVPVGLALATITTSPIFQKSVFLFPFIFFGRKLYSFSKGMASYFCVLLGMLADEWEPTPCYRDAYSVDTLQVGLLGERLADAL